MYTRSTSVADAIAERKWWVVDLDGQGASFCVSHGAGGRLRVLHRVPCLGWAHLEGVSIEVAHLGPLSNSLSAVVYRDAEGGVRSATRVVCPVCRLRPGEGRTQGAEAAIISSHE